MATAPHAYSSDTLQKAYQWLQNNPQHQSSIQSSDQLVALYLSETKGLQSFDFAPNTTTSLFLSQNTNKPSINNINITKKNTKANLPLKTDGIVSDVDSGIGGVCGIADDVAVAGAGDNTTDSFFALDKTSLGYLKETQKTFNLSTQSEALRLLLSIGYEKLHKI
ncbi:MAG: hypothetical protein HAW63_02950 [Bdellovibrionaceae bacterium]|nr:hypothetical protein [Pseudobdellovibrionaceae bacterium]